MMGMRENNVKLLNAILGMSTEKIDSVIAALDRGELPLGDVSAESVALFRYFLCLVRASKAGGAVE